MAALVLTVVGGAIGSAIGGTVAGITAATIGATIGGVVGSVVDAELFSGGGGATQTVNQQGPRLDTLQVQASTEGAPIPEAIGRERVAGQVIWASRFREEVTTSSEHQGGGGKGNRGGGGVTVQTTTYTYFVSLAVALCEGPIERVGNVWADGQPLDTTTVTMRVYAGTGDQSKDSLIVGIQGDDQTPAYRHTAYVVFDDLQITQFGNRIPQLNFEVFRSGTGSDPNSIQKNLHALTVIPGAGAWVYDTVPHSLAELIMQFAVEVGTANAKPQNTYAGRGGTDFIAAMDDMQATFSGLATASLVVSWFGDDLRAASCTCRPKVDKVVEWQIPTQWAVGGVQQLDADPMSQWDGRPAYGDTPDDSSVAHAARNLHDRGLSVIFYPFLSMDIPHGNTLPDPWNGAGSQPPYPWRGRVTCDPAIGQPGSPDQTGGATGQINAFFGTAWTGDESCSVDAGSGNVTTDYHGANEWKYRRFILHYAHLVAAINAAWPGAISAFMIGSELRGLTFVRDSATHFPAVDALVALANDVKGIVGAGVKVGYGGDWTEYNGYQPPGTNNHFFHLDPLWSNGNVDFVGVDLYIPLSDWRPGSTHLDAQGGVSSVYDIAYLKGNVEGGEDYDWFYASQADRDAQRRTAITDGYGEPWTWRFKDFRNWWLNAHHDRPSGLPGAQTAWVPQSKPIWFTEFGCPSINLGSNEPNVFYDPKSSESFFPYYSSGQRDDLIQRRTIEALLAHWRENNPTSSVYGGPMVGNIVIWTWDARPYPTWPARSDVWGDTPEWPLGHWLNGKVGGTADLAALVESRCERVGFTATDVSLLLGIVTGYLRDRPMSPRAEIEMLMAAFFFDAVESDGIIKFVPRGGAPLLTYDQDDLVASDDGEAIASTRTEDASLPDGVTVTFLDANNDYQSASVSTLRSSGHSERITNTTLALVMDDGQAQQVSDTALAEAWISREAARFSLPPSAIALDPADVIGIVVNGRARTMRVGQIDDSGPRAVQATRAATGIYGPILPIAAAPKPKPAPSYASAMLVMLDLPMLSDAMVPYAPWFAANSSPYAGVTVMDSATGADFAVDTVLPAAATIGQLTADLYQGPTAYFDTVNTAYVQLLGGTLSSQSDDALLAGIVNAIAVQNADGQWEVLQFGIAELNGTNSYKLSRLLRGRLGTEHAMRDPVAKGAAVVLLNSALVQPQCSLAERGVPRFYRWGASPLSSTDLSWQQAQLTMHAVGLMPWSPVHIAGAWNAAGDIAITWVRRTRLDGFWADNVDVPLNEAAEAYQVDILDGTNVVRTIAATAPSCTYTAAEQAADLGAAATSLKVNVYQLSASVGRGWPGSATLQKG